MQTGSAGLGPAARRQRLRERLRLKDQRHSGELREQDFDEIQRTAPESLEYQQQRLEEDTGDQGSKGSNNDDISYAEKSVTQRADELNVKVNDGVRISLEQVNERKEREASYWTHKASCLEQAAEEDRLNLLEQGETFVRQIHEGRVLFHGTGLANKDPLFELSRNAYAESELYQETQQEWTLRSPEYREVLAGTTPRSRKIREDHDRELENLVDSKKLEYNKKWDFLHRIQRADREATEAHDSAEAVAAEAFTLLDKLRKQHNVLSFEARAKTRRLMLEKQAEAASLKRLALVAKEDAKQLKRHMIEQGLNPDTFVSVNTKVDHLLPKDQTTPKFLVRTILPGVQATSSKISEPDKITKDETNAKASGDEEEEAPLATPDPEDWNYHLREGLKMSHLDLMDSSQKRQNRIADAEAGVSRQQGEELAAIKQRLQLAQKAQRQARRAAAALARGRPVSQGSQASTESFSRPPSQQSDGTTGLEAETEEKIDIIERLDDKDYVSAAMSAENVTLQSKSILGKQEEIDAAIVGGMTHSTAPPFCEDWGLRQRCLKKDCPGRHFYISSQEAHDWQHRRAESDAALEMNVLEAISSREQLIATLREETENCRRKFQDHLSGHVQTDDVGSLLFLLNKLRISSVRVVEAVVKWRKRGEMEFANTGGAASTFENSFLKPYGWVVKMGYYGERLYPGSKAFRSKVRRFNRDEDVDGKKALLFRYVGIYETREEALRAYEDEIKRLMAKEMCGPDKFPRPKFIIRSCGKHFAVESDMGVTDTRCEFCFANSFNRFGSYTPSYLWNSQNYLLKMLHDTDFLQNIELLQLFFKKQFLDQSLSFRNNPFMLATDIAQGERRRVRVRKVRDTEEAVTESTPENVAATFGVPTDSVLVHGNQCLEWHGHMSRGPHVTVGKQRAYVSLCVTSRKLVDDFVRKHEPKSFEVLHMKRIRDAQGVIREEEDLARYMQNSRLDAKTQAAKAAIEADKKARREDRERRREQGEEVEDSDSEWDDSTDEEIDENVDNSAPSLKRGAQRHTNTKGRKRKPQLFRTYKTADVLTEAELNDLSGKTTRRKKKQYQPLTIAERLPEDRIHTAYFWERGEYIAVQQVRHHLVGKKPGVWATGEAGTYFEGMQLRGENQRRYDFHRKLKEQGKVLNARRARIQKRLAKSIRRGDACNPDTIMQLVELGRIAGGSLLIMDCDSAELFIQKWHERTRAAGVIQRNLRASVARALCTQMRVGIAQRATLELHRGRNCVKVARSFTQKVFRKTIRKAKLRLKQPLLTKGVEYDGEKYLVSVHDTRKLDRHHRAKAELIEPCFACLGLTSRTRERREFAWLSVRGEPCPPGNIGIVDRGIVKLERTIQKTSGGSPCYCQRKHPPHKYLLFQAYHPATSKTICGVFTLSSLLRGLKHRASILERARCALQRASQHLLSADPTLLRMATDCGKAVVTPSRYLTQELRLPLVSILDVHKEMERRGRHNDRMLKGCQNLVEAAQQRAKILQDEASWLQKADEEGTSGLDMAHAVMLAAQVHKHAMVQATAVALNFSKRQIELYEDLSLSTAQQAWDPIENANNAIYIQRKWQATKAVELAIQLRNRSIKRAFQANLQYVVVRAKAKAATALASAIQRNIVPCVNQFSQDTKLTQQILQSSIVEILSTAISSVLTLKHGRQTRAGPLTQSLCLLYRQPSQLRSTIHHNTLFRQGRMIVSPPFVDQNIRTRIGIVQVFELDAPSKPRAPALPPTWIRSKFVQDGLQHAPITGFDPHVTLQGPIFGAKERELSIDDTMRMLVRDPISWSRSLAYKWAIQFDVADAVLQPPYMGTIRVNVYDQRKSNTTEWEINPIELRLLLLETHVDLPGRPIPEVFSYAHVRKLMLSSVDSGGALTHQSMRNALEQLRAKVVARLVQLIHLNVYDGELRLGKLSYFRLRRNLFNSLFTTQWWKDLQQGRSSSQGHFIYGGPHIIAGSSAMVGVFENCGDITVRVCWARPKALQDGRRLKRCRVTLRDESIRQMFQESGDLESFVLWKQSVKCCQYSPQIIQEILHNLTLEGAKREGLCEKQSQYYGPAYTGKDRLWLAGQPLRTRYIFLPVTDARGGKEQDDPLKLVINARSLYQLVHREVLFVSGAHLVVSGRLRDDGDILIEALKQDQSLLRIRLSRTRVRGLLTNLDRTDLLDRKKAKELFAMLYSFLAIRTDTRPPHTIREHPYFMRYCMMLQVGVPRGAVAHAILHDPKRQTSVMDAISVVLHSDHSNHPPERFRLPPVTYELLIFSQSKPEEHFRMIHRGLVQVQNNTAASLDILERNRNLWLRLRRETQVEKDERIARTELDEMLQEDNLSRESEKQTALYVKEDANPLLTLVDSDARIPEAVRVVNQLARMELLRSRRLQSILRQLSLDVDTRSIIWPEAVTAMRQGLALRSPFPKQPPRGTSEFVKRVAGIGCRISSWTVSPGLAAICVRVPSWSLHSIKIIDLDMLSPSTVQAAQKLLEQGLRAASTAFHQQIKIPLGTQNHAQTIFRGASKGFGLFRIRYELLSGSIFLQASDGMLFVSNGVKISNSVCSQDEQIQESNCGADLKESISISRGTVNLKSEEVLLHNKDSTEATISSDNEEIVENEVHIKTQIDETSLMVTPHTPVVNGGYQIELDLLRRYTLAAARLTSSDVIFQEMYDKVNFVGHGPVAGGALAEQSTEAQILEKHSITVPGDALDILSGAHDLSSLLLTKELSELELGRLISWLTSRINFHLASRNSDGKKDVARFNWEIIRQGRLIADLHRKKRRIIVRGMLSERAEYVELQTFNFGHGSWVKQISLSLTRGQLGSTSADMHEFVNLVPQHEGIQALVEQVGISITEPRRVQELLQKMLARSCLVIEEERLLDAEAFELSMYRERQARAAELKHQEAHKAKLHEGLQERCREHCEAVRVAYMDDLQERASRYDRLSQLRRSIPEWPQMAQADAESTTAKPYLTADAEKLRLIEKAFNRFDANHDGGLDAQEFRSLAFAIGHVLTTEEASEALRWIDADNNGDISLLELSLWALCEARTKDRDMKFRRLQLELRLNSSLAAATRVFARASATASFAARSTSALSSSKTPKRRSTKTSAKITGSAIIEES